MSASSSNMEDGDVTFAAELQRGEFRNRPSTLRILSSFLEEERDSWTYARKVRRLAFIQVLYSYLSASLSLQTPWP